MAASGTGPLNFTDDLIYDDSSRINLEEYKTILPTNTQENSTRLIRKSRSRFLYSSHNK